jgi:hypothetical protein
LFNLREEGRKKGRRKKRRKKEEPILAGHREIELEEGRT